MQRILRLLLALSALIALTGLVACGGDDDELSSSTDVNTLLEKTFTGKKDIQSGQFQMELSFNAEGGGSQLSGPVDVTLGGPFASTGKNKLPKFDIDLKFSGAGQNISGGILSTGDGGYVSFNGQDYVLSDQTFQQFKQGYEQAAAQGAERNEDTSLATLGIDPRKWLTDPENAGEAKVGDTDVIRITGGVDVAKLLDDVNTALAKAGSLGLQGQAELPTKLTEEQKKQVQEAVKDVQFELATGKEDTILRRMAVDLKLEDPQGGGGTADVSFSIQLTELNEEQSFDAPEDAKPFEELLQQFGGLGGLGALGGLGGAGGGAGGGTGGAGAGGASPEALEEYTTCLEQAGEDIQAAQDCAKVLAP